MPRHQFKPGEVANPKGRQKGSVNKFTTLKAAFLSVFERMGGEEALLEWAKASNHNTAAFYQWITKMLPADLSVGGKDGGAIQHEVQFIMPRPEEKKDKP